MQVTELKQTEQIYTVSRLNNEVKYLLEETFPYVWVEGEISNFAAPQSGHWYFSLKDATAQVRCAMFRGSQRNLGFTPKDGAQILIRARVSLYENRGEFQLIAEHMEERGEGKLRRAYEALKKKLEAAGLFADSNKKPLPLYPKTIGVITSNTGAAIRDILIVLKRRYSAANVIIYPTLVQGETAAPAIIAAIQTANIRAECDILILARGGGSLEDLWPFNEEMVAQAIFQSQLPIVSGIGHEVDFTIADFVADKRAPTPSAAAEIITPDGDAILRSLIHSKQWLLKLCQKKINDAKKQLEWSQKNLLQQHPKRQLTNKMQRLDLFETDLLRLQTQQFNYLQHQLKDLQHRLYQYSPERRINYLKNTLSLLEQRLFASIKTILQQSKNTLRQHAGTLDALSPLATLKRGFAIATDKEQRVISDAAQLHIGDQLQVRLQKGEARCRVEEICPSD